MPKLSIHLKKAWNISLIILGLSALWSTSCKEKTIIPGSLNPDVDNIHTFELEADFFNPTLQVAQKDSVKTSDYKEFTIGLGKVTGDPFYGSVSAGLFFQVSPPSNFFQFPNGLHFDSAFVVLPYAMANYGDTTLSIDNNLHLDVFQITEQFSRANDYYSFQQLQFSPQIIGGGSYNLQSLNDTSFTSIDTISHQLKIKLKNNFAQTIVNADESRFFSNGSFVEFLKGLYIRPKDTAATQKRISYFNLLGTKNAGAAGIKFYFHNDSSEVKSFIFPFNSQVSAYFNQIVYNNSSFPAANYTGIDRNVDTLLIQGNPGFYTNLTLKNIDQIPDAAINKAQLIITSLPLQQENIYQYPTRLYLEIKDTAGQYKPIPDMLGLDGSISSSGSAFINGNVKFITINGNKHAQYELNIPRTIQKAMMDGESEVHLRISDPTLYYGQHRLLAQGLNGNIDTRLKLKVIYTKK